jgi:glycosyltransferase involved in cell wall biosynthesis
MSVFSIILATSDSERALLPTLAALVPGATAGIVREVIVADAGSRDGTREIADFAGCEFVATSGSLGVRLSAAAQSARGDWLMFLQPGAVPGPTWIDETIAFAERTGRETRGAVFAAHGGVLARLRERLQLPRATQGLIIRRTAYHTLGGHRAEAADPERALLRRLGRTRLAVLRTPVTFPDI